MVVNDVELCAFCNTAPTLEKRKPDGSIWDLAGRYVCKNVGCKGQGKTAAMSFAYKRNWNTRQRQYANVIKKAKAVIPSLWVDSFEQSHVGLLK